MEMGLRELWEKGGAPKAHPNGHRRWPYSPPFGRGPFVILGESEFSITTNSCNSNNLERIGYLATQPILTTQIILEEFGI